LKNDIDWNNLKIESDKTSGQFSRDTLLIQVKSNELQAEVNYKLPGLLAKNTGKAILKISNFEVKIFLKMVAGQNKITVDRSEF